MDYKELEERLTSPKRKMNRADFERKLRANKYIMETLSEEELNTYLEQCDYQAVIDVVDKVYGQEAGDILRERPLSTDDIPTFNIFDSRIGDTIGYGGVHTFLTYYMASSAAVIDKMVENPELIDLYITYKEQLGDYYPPSAIGLHEGLLTFDKHKDLIAEVSRVGWDDELRENFLLRIRDEENPDLTDIHISNYKTQHQSLSQFTLDHYYNTPKTVEGLRNYKNSRNQLIDKELDGLINNDLADADSYLDCQNLLKFKYFGNIRHNDDYNHEYFLKDYLSFYTAEFSDYEISSIYLYSIIEQTDDIDVLKQIDKALSQTDHINPLDMKSIDSKVAEIYRQEYLNSTITLDKAKRMAESHENGSYKGLLKSDGTIVCEDHKILPDGTKQEKVVLPSGGIITKSTSDGKSSYEITTAYGNTYSEYKPYEIDINEDTHIEQSSNSEKQIIYSKFLDKPIVFHLQNSKIISCFLNNNNENLVDSISNFQETDYQKTLNSILTDEKYREAIQTETIDIMLGKKTLSLSSYFEKGEPIKNDITPTEKNEQPVYFLNTTEETFFEHNERGFTSEFLMHKINNTLGEKYLNETVENGIDRFSAEELVVINASLEGGLTSISAYYNNKPNDSIGYVNKIHPNAIFSRAAQDAGVSHTRKNLNFAGKSTSNLMEFGTSKDRLAFRNNQPGSVSHFSAEVAYLRYEWDITQIKPGTKGGRVPIDFVISGKVNNEKAAKYALSAGVPLVKIMSGKERHTYLEDAPRRKESENISLLRQALDQADDKKITSDEIKTASQLLLKIKEAELQKNDEGR